MAGRRMASRRPSWSPRPVGAPLPTRSASCGCARRPPRPGYYERPEETAATFHATIEGEPDVRYLRTGDYAFIRDGQIHIVGRAKDLLIINGRNVHATDVELAAQDGHPSVRRGGLAAFSVDTGEREEIVVVIEVDGTPDARRGRRRRAAAGVRRARGAGRARRAHCEARRPQDHQRQDPASGVAAPIPGGHPAATCVLTAVASDGGGDRRPRVVVAGQLPPPLSGQHLAVSWNFEELSTDGRFDVELLEFRFAETMEHQGRLSLRKVVELARVLWRLAGIRLRGPIDLLLYPMSGATTGATLRDIVLLPPIRLLARRVVLRFHGAGHRSWAGDRRPLVRLARAVVGRRRRRHRQRRRQHGRPGSGRHRPRRRRTPPGRRHVRRQPRRP